jgi:beta-galactosidase
VENTIQIIKNNFEKGDKLLPMGGRDKAGNRFEVDNISFMKNGRRFIPIMGEFHFSRYEPEAWEEDAENACRRCGYYRYLCILDTP